MTMSPPSSSARVPVSWEAPSVSRTRAHPPVARGGVDVQVRPEGEHQDVGHHGRPGR